MGSLWRQSFSWKGFLPFRWSLPSYIQLKKKTKRWTSIVYPAGSVLCRWNRFVLHTENLRCFKGSLHVYVQPYNQLCRQFVCQTVAHWTRVMNNRQDHVFWDWTLAEHLQTLPYVFVLMVLNKSWHRFQNGWHFCLYAQNPMTETFSAEAACKWHLTCMLFEGVYLFSEVLDKYTK